MGGDTVIQTELDDFKSPNRKPWLILLILAIVAVVVWDRLRDKPEKKASEPRPMPEEAAAIQEQVAVEPTAEPPPPPAASARTAPTPAAAAAPAAALAAPVVASDTLFGLAQKYAADGERVRAREAYLTLLSRGNLPENLRADVETKLGALNVELVLTPLAMPGKVEHVVKSGESLEKIAKKYKTTVDSIQLGNGLANPNMIKAGDRLLVLTGAFEIDVSTDKHTLLVALNDEFFKRYLVGTGKMDKTPKGTFVITEKIKEPVWWRPDGKEVPFGNPENILGTHWMTLRATGETPDVHGYGIHGTWEDGSIGKAESAGCVRMLNREVEELFALIPSGTPVTIGK
jgi:lipoprotein-anchoring transpeptidase ErfK/SrfK